MIPVTNKYIAIAKSAEISIVNEVNMAFGITRQNKKVHCFPGTIFGRCTGEIENNKYGIRLFGNDGYYNDIVFIEETYFEIIEETDLNTLELQQITTNLPFYDLVKSNGIDKTLFPIHASELYGRDYPFYRLDKFDPFDYFKAWNKNFEHGSIHEHESDFKMFRTEEELYENRIGEAIVPPIITKDSFKINSVKNVRIQSIFAENNLIGEAYAYALGDLSTSINLDMDLQIDGGRKIIEIGVELRGASSDPDISWIGFYNAYSKSIYKESTDMWNNVSIPELTKNIDITLNPIRTGVSSFSIDVNDPNYILSSTKLMYPNGLWIRFFVSNYGVVTENSYSPWFEIDTQLAESINFDNGLAQSTLVYKNKPSITAILDSFNEGEFTITGKIKNNAKSLITAYGVCYSASHNPTVADSKVQIAGNPNIPIGPFRINVEATTGTHYAKFYVINTEGTHYYDEIAVTIPASSGKPILADLTTITKLTNKKVYFDSKIISGTVTEKGVIMSESFSQIWLDGITPFPRVEGPNAGSNRLIKITETSPTNNIIVNNDADLKPNTVYFARTFATNSTGTSYGKVMCFKTYHHDEATLPTIVTKYRKNRATKDSEIFARVTSLGHSTLREYGLCYAKHNEAGFDNTDPTINNHVSKYTNPYYTEWSEFPLVSDLFDADSHYYVRPYAINGMGVAYGETIAYTTTPVYSLANDIILQEAFDITSNYVSARIFFPYFRGNEQHAIVERGICWGKKENPHLEDCIGYVTQTSGFGETTVLTTTSTLEPNTSYFICAYYKGKDRNGIVSSKPVYSDDVIFITTDENATKVLPTISLVSILNSTESPSTKLVAKANLSANGFDTITEKGFYISEFADMTYADKITILGSNIGEFSNTFNDLTPNKTYYIQAFATNGIGMKKSLPIASKKTLATDETSIATIRTISDNTNATITLNSVIINSIIDSNGGLDITEKGVCIGTTANPDITKAVKSTDPLSNTNFNTNIIGLIPGTRYNIRSYAINSKGVAYSANSTFDTKQGALATVTTASVTKEDTTAISGGNITNDGGLPILSRGVCWSVNLIPTIANAKTNDGIGVGSFVSNVTGLISGTEYYLCAYATNSLGTAYGSIIKFRANAAPSVSISPDITNITASGCNCIGTIISLGGSGVILGEFGICYSKINPPTVNDKRAIGAFYRADYEFKSSLTGLDENTTYYLRAYAINKYGVSYSTLSSVTTLTSTTGSSIITVPTLLNKSVTTNSIIVGTGNVISSVNNIIEKGVYWSESSIIIPTQKIPKKVNGVLVKDKNVYEITIDSLKQNTLYTIWPYAIDVNNVEQKGASLSIKTSSVIDTGGGTATEFPNNPVDGFEFTATTRFKKRTWKYDALKIKWELIKEELITTTPAVVSRAQSSVAVSSNQLVVEEKKMIAIDKFIYPDHEVVDFFIKLSLSQNTIFEHGESVKLKFGENVIENVKAYIHGKETDHEDIKIMFIPLIHTSENPLTTRSEEAYAIDNTLYVIEIISVDDTTKSLVPKNGEKFRVEDIAGFENFEQVNY